MQCLQLTQSYIADKTVFLDLPAPWEAIPLAVKNLNVSGSGC